jgi:hypothetical protein
METCHSDLEGWTTISNYKQLDDSDSDDDSESSDDTVRGYQHEKYKKILFVEDLLPE